MPDETRTAVPPVVIRTDGPPTRWGPRADSDYKVYAALAQKHTVFFTPEVLSIPRQLKDDLAHITARVSIRIDQHIETLGKLTGPPRTRTQKIELIIIDESERLRRSVIEYLRDRYDTTNIGLILMGMPGIEKQFSRYPQLYSRVGFTHEHRPLVEEELRFALERRWRKLGQTLTPTTTLVSKLSPRSLASPGATSASSTDASHKSNAS